MTSILEGQPPQKKAFSNQKKGHLGSSLQSQFFRLKSSLVLASVAPLPSVAVYILWLVNTALILQPPLAKGRHLCIMRPQHVADFFWELCFP